jgi:hypothetical protein
LKKKIIRIKSWDDFKKRAFALYPKSVIYFIQRAPLSKPSIGLRLMFTSENSQYVFLDYAKGEALKQTKIPVSINKQGEAYLKDEDIKHFITTELKRTDLLILSPVWRMEWQ